MLSFKHFYGEENRNPKYKLFNLPKRVVRIIFGSRSRLSCRPDQQNYYNVNFPKYLFFKLLYLLVTTSLSLEETCLL